MQDAVKLLREVAEVATSTGMETGLRRGLQAAQAAAATAAEVAQQPPSQLDEAFVAKVLRKLFEKLLGGNFQTSLEVQSPFFTIFYRLVSEEPLFFIRGLSSSKRNQFFLMVVDFQGSMFYVVDFQGSMFYVFNPVNPG